MHHVSETDLPTPEGSIRSRIRPIQGQLLNSLFGLLDYSAYPIGMLAVAPIILRNLGIAQYGIWTIAMAAVSFGSIIASGFGDATLQKVATERGRGSWDNVIRLVRSALGIHLVLGSALSAALWFLAPHLAGLAVADPILRKTCLYCFRIAAPLIFIRSVETVCVSTQRGFERYGAAVRISVAGRMLGLVAAAVLASNSFDVAGMMIAITALPALALVVQLIELNKLLRIRSLVPAFEPSVTRDLLYFGLFTWILSATGVVFSQCDRLIGGASLGASAVVAYALCAQVAQPVYGLTAAGLHFLFPYIAFRQVNQNPLALKRTVLRSVLLNWLLVSIGAGLVFIFSHQLLRLLATEALAESCAPMLSAVLASSVLLALTVSGNYAMMALGHARPIAFINIGASVVMGLVILWLLPGKGIWAIISGRLAFASIALLVYIPLALKLSDRDALSFPQTDLPAEHADRTVDVAQKPA